MDGHADRRKLGVETGADHVALGTPKHVLRKMRPRPDSLRTIRKEVENPFTWKRTNP